MQTDPSVSSDHASSGLIATTELRDAMFAPLGHFHVECRGSNDELKWVEDIRNIVTVTGKQLALDVLFGATSKPSWFIILKGAGSSAAADTLASHAGWTEYTNYTGNRPAVTFTAATVVSTTGAQVTHTAVGFTISSAGGTVAGAGASSVATGTSGTLYNSGDFSASRTVASGDTLNVTLTLSLAA